MLTGSLSFLLNFGQELFCCHLFGLALQPVFDRLLVTSQITFLVVTPVLFPEEIPQRFLLLWDKADFGGKAISSVIVNPEAFPAHPPNLANLTDMRAFTLRTLHHFHRI